MGEETLVGYCVQSSMNLSKTLGGLLSWNNRHLPVVLTHWSFMADELKNFHIIPILGGGMQWYYEHRRYKRWIYMGEIIELNAVAFFISSFAKKLIITIQSIQN